MQRRVAIGDYVDEYDVLSDRETPEKDLKRKRGEDDNTGSRDGEKARHEMLERAKKMRRVAENAQDLTELTPPPNASAFAVPSTQAKRSVERVKSTAQGNEGPSGSQVVIKTEEE
ncbi:hypothetical protein NMY22_g17343 [Coprinellus aureogranulatus]|nr:hypothetical protein NMY22_g17343 [Coprinellus aureogranulatus]